MSNTLFRKGLVAAAIAGLAASAFAGTPAFAAAGVTLAPTTGTGYTVNAGDSFVLTATSSSEVPSSSYSTLEFAVTNVDGVAANATVSGTTISHTPAAHSAVALGTTAASTTSAHALQYTGTTVAGTPDVTSYSNNPTLTLSGTSSSVTSHYVVSAFLDANGNGVADSGELVSTQTVTFAKAADLSVTTSIASIYTNATTANATFVVNNSGWNTAQASAPTLKFTNGVAAEIVTAPAVGAQATQWVSADSKYELIAAITTAALAKGTIVNAQAYVGATAVGAAASTTVADKAIATLVGSIAKSASAQGSTTATAINSTSLVSTAANTAAYQVKTNGSFTVSALASDATPAAVAGRTVSFVVNTGATLSSTTGSVVSITINGTTYTSNTTLNAATITAVTGADGKATLVISTSGYTTGQGFKVVATEEGISAAAVYAVATDSAYTAVFAAGSEFQTAIGATQSASVIVVDQYGTAIADGSDAIATATVSAGTAAAPATVVSAVVGGKATLALADSTGTATNGARNITWAVKVAKRDAVTLNYPAGISAGNVVVHTVANALDNAPATAVVTGPATVSPITTGGTDYSTTATAAVETGTFSANDPRIGQGSNPTLATAGLAVAGTISSVSSPTHTAAGIAGVNVTLTKAGDLFYDAATGVYALDSITVQTNASGVFGATVYSHVAGSQVISIASGAAVASLKYSVNAPEANTGASVVISAPATALPGTTASVTATVVDKFGNTVLAITAAPATISETIVGVGTGAGVSRTSLTNSATPALATQTDYVTFGANEAGTVTVTVTYDADGAGTASAAVTGTATIKVAAPAAAKNTVAVATSQAQVGAAVDVTATAVDAAGKPAAGVVVSFTVAGQGYLSTASATTNAAGVATVKLVSNVAGMNTVSAAANGVATAATAAVTFGNADANITFNSNKRRATATYEFAGNAKVVISVNGVRVKTLYPADDMVGSYSVSLKKGKNKVSVSVAGVTTDSRTVTTK